MCDAFRTDVHPMTPDGICKWSLHESKSCTRSDISLIFKVFFSPKVHWMNISTSIDKSIISTPATIISEDKSIELVFEYSTNDNFSQELGTHTVIKITSIIIHLLHVDATMEAFQRYENHKISLLLRVFRRDTTMTMRSVYIGRAQEIQTTEHGGTRTYTWLSTAEIPVFEGIGFRRISENIDMDAISHAPNISPRPQQSYIMDNDEFNNPSRVLPTGIMVGETLNLEFFNFKFNPPKCLEVQIPWKDIIDIPTLFTIKDPQSRKIVKKRFSLSFRSSMANPPVDIAVARYEVNPSEGIIVRITYERINADRIAIREVKFIIRKYLLALHYLGQGTSARTV